MKQYKRQAQHTGSSFWPHVNQIKENSNKQAATEKSFGDSGTVSPTPPILRGQGVKASPWGRLVGLLVLISLAVITNAQPLPPSTPHGSPVPVEGLLALLPAALIVLGIVRLSGKRQKK